MLKERVFTTDGHGLHESSVADAEDFLNAALMAAIPASLKSIEENTTPSWLWQRRANGKEMSRETSTTQIFDRIAGSTTYAGWKQGMFDDEQAAKIFCDELRFLLTRRIIAIEPLHLATLGSQWAYGYSQKTTHTTYSSAPQRQAVINNATLDAISSGKAATASQWRKRIADITSGEQLTIKFADTINEWGAGVTDGSPRLMIDLLAFYRQDGTIDIAALQQAVRISTLFLDLQYEALATNITNDRALSIGYANLSALLMALAIPYDSEAGRSTAAAITAIITAEATMTSAELAGFLGQCDAFAAQRETAFRVLRNRRRSAYGEQNDYEHLSIIPTPLKIESGADLVLIAAARHCWDEALAAVRQHGLRNLQTTQLFNTTDFATYLNCSAQGIEPEQLLVRQQAVSAEEYRRVIHPAVPLALARLGCDPADIKAIIDHTVGYQTLAAAPGINHTHLRALGFDASALARLEAQLPRVTHIRHAFTPWVLGEKFCREKLKLKNKAFEDYSFDMLAYFGFSQLDIAKANAFCCGHGTPLDAAELPEAGKNLFTPPRAMVQMTAAVQAFISNDTNLVVTMSGHTSAEKRTSCILEAWRAGLKSITLRFDYSETPKPHVRAMIKPAKLMKRKTPAFATPVRTGDKPTIARMTAPRNTKPKASLRSLGLKHGKPKSGGSLRPKGH